MSPLVDSVGSICDWARQMPCLALLIQAPADGVLHAAGILQPRRGVSPNASPSVPCQPLVGYDGLGSPSYAETT